ncbi:hypothetical protein ACIP6P_32555 [Streptomyces sp. NPDC088729]|uniref:hypothetical protein n=1 Tax=Streptomyces sp. NPDC088729 TaxID=3365876 RepID=UPI0037F2AC6A
MTHRQEQDAEHCEECPVVSGSDAAACRCERIVVWEEWYRAEPDDMWAREWGAC